MKIRYRKATERLHCDFVIEGGVYYVTVHCPGVGVLKGAGKTKSEAINAAMLLLRI